VIPEGEYTVEYDHLKSSPAPLADWVIKTTDLDTKKEEFKKAVEDFKDGKISEVPGLEYNPGEVSDSRLSYTRPAVLDLSEYAEKANSYIAPRLDNLQEKLGVVIAVGSSTDDKIEKLYNLIDENETNATNSLERVIEIQESLEDFKDRVNDKLSCIVSNQNTINDNTRRCLESISKGNHQALETYQEEINNRFDDMSLKFDSLGQSHSTTKSMLNRLEVCIDKIKQDLVEQRSGIGGIVDVMQRTLEAMEKEFNEAKDRQISVKASADSLIVALYDVVQYQERILQNQERKGFWNWLKSLFKK
jgi:DNA-binding ferritin-like protein